MAEEDQHSVGNSTDPPADRGSSDTAALGVEDVMARLSLSRAHVYRLVKDGVLNAGKNDAHLAFSECDVAATAKQLSERREKAEALLGILAADLAEHGIDDLPDVSADDYEAVVNEVVEKLFLAGMAARASDIYVMPYEDGDRLLARVAGRLQEIARVDSELGVRIREGLKALAPLPEPESGPGNAAVFKHAAHNLSAVVRLSVTPTLAGDHLHLQLFSANGERSFASLGFTAQQSEVFQELLSGKSGLFVLAGSQARFLQELRLALADYLDSLGKLVVSIGRVPSYLSENSVHLDGRKADEAEDADPWQTALGLCPDAIMLDRIEDSDQAAYVTAALAAGVTIIVHVQRATGAAALQELAELGLGHYELNRYFRAACEFEAVPRLCPDCRAPRAASASEAKELGESASAQLYTAVGCEHCQAGYRGTLPVWGLLCEGDLESAKSPDGEVSVIQSGGKPYSRDTSLAAALRHAALAGETTFRHVEPYLR